MKNFILFFGAFLISYSYGNSFELDFEKIKNLKTSRNFGFSQIIALQVEFAEDASPNTTGNGKFLETLDIKFINSDEDRCDGFIVDRPPHNRDYFQSQIQAVRNYYYNVSNGNFDFQFHVLENIYTLNKEMSEYSISDNTIGELFSDSLEEAQTDIIDYLGSDDPDFNDVLFVIFHAGVGQDISFPYVDPTNYDIPSAYIEESMLSTTSKDSWMNQNGINRGIVLPETLNHIHYDIIEDLFFGIDDYCDYQIGLTGLFSLLVGYSLELPVLFNTENGRSGVGIFGLMDYGSNNGYGVIPSPPSPFSLISKQWNNYSHSNLGQNTLDTDAIHKVDLAKNEYILLQNKNNWIFENVDIDSLRNKNKIWNESIKDSVPGHFFDNLIYETNNTVTVDASTGVITSVDNYDYGLPGSGIVMWHINESFLSQEAFGGINNDPYQKAVKIKEADGSMDIGFECYSWNPSICTKLTNGWQYDMWYNDNESFIINNPNLSEIQLSSSSNPSSLTDDEAISSVEIKNFSGNGTTMTYDYQKNNTFEYETIGSGEIEIIGSGTINDIGCIFYKESANFYKFCYGSQREEITNEMGENEIVLVYENNFYPAKNKAFIDLLGNLQDNVDNLGIFGYFESTTSLSQNMNGSSAGDVDNDGLDEIISLTNYGIDVVNNNGTSCDNFPVESTIENTVLVANIINTNQNQPELIFRQNNSIVIMSNGGEILNLIASNSNQSLRLVSWGEKIALIDGNKLLLFDYDNQRTYWTSNFGTDWNYPMPSPNSQHTIPSFTNDGDLESFYNYPNPVRDGNTNFRFYFNDLSMNPVIKIYNIGGALIEVVQPTTFNFLPNEFNEIEMNFSSYDTGVYFAEIYDQDIRLGFTKVAIIK